MSLQTARYLVNDGQAVLLDDAQEPLDTNIVPNV